MAWIESHDELLSHPKSKRLKRRLNVSEHEVIGLLHYFWHWAVKFAEDGKITKFTAEDIADAIHFNGDADNLMQSLIESGFVDSVDGELMIHDWFDYAGKLILWRRKEADRLKSYRSNKKKEPSVHSTIDERTPYEPSTNEVRTPVYSNSNSKSNKKDKEYIQLEDMPHVRITTVEFNKLVNLLGSEEKAMSKILYFASWILGQPDKKQKSASPYLSITAWHKRDLEKKETDKPKKASQEREVEWLT